MKSRLIDHGIGMGLIQSLPLTPTTQTGEILLTLISVKPNVLHLKICYPLTNVM